MIERLRARIVASRDGSERGAVLVLTVLSLVPICLFAALAIDLGNIAQSHTNAKNATDSAALAGAGLLGSTSYAQGNLSQATIVTDVEDEVVQDASSSSGLSAGSSAWDTCTATLPSGWPTWPDDAAGNIQNCIAFNSTSTIANLVQVAIPPQFVRSMLGQVGGVAGQGVSAVSTAEVTNEVAAPCGLCVMGPTGTTLSSTGNSSITVTSPVGSGGNSNIIVDSSGQPAASISGGLSTITALDGQIETVGTTSGSGFNPTATRLAQPIADPLAAVPTPSWTSLPVGTNNGSVSCSSCGSITINPGIYSSISGSGNGSTIIMEPGVYVITGSISTSGTAGLSGSGVLLYFTCGSGTVPQACKSTGQRGGSFQTTGDGTLDITPLSATNCALANPNACAYSGDFELAVMYDRHDTSTLSLTGNAGSSFTGTVYADSGQMTLTGNGGTVNSLIDVGSLGVVGNATISISYNPIDNVSAKPPDQPELCSINAGSC